MNIFESFFDTAETVLTDVQEGTDAISPIAAAVPGASPVVTAVQGGVTAAKDAITAGQAIVAAATPEVTSLIGIFENLFHITKTPQAIVLTPKTTAATTAS